MPASTARIMTFVRRFAREGIGAKRPGVEISIRWTRAFPSFHGNAETL
jgi:hypothetical protein